jgi:hypothetical protein
MYLFYCSSGEILVWNFSREDDMLVASSGIGDDSHREPVSKVQWISDPDSKGKKYDVSLGEIMVVGRDENFPEIRFFPAISGVFQSGCSHL